MYQSILRQLLQCCLLFFVICFVYQSFTGVAYAQKTPEAFDKKTPASGGDSTTYQRMLKAYLVVHPQGTSPDAAKARLARNDLINEVVNQSDEYFRVYRKKKTQGNRWFQTIIDLIEIGAAAAIPIVGGVRDKSNIAQGINFIHGSRIKVNENFKLELMGAIFNKAQENMAEKLIPIYQKLDVSDEEFPWSQAKAMLHGYWEAGTIEDALPGVIADTQKTKENAQSRRDEALKNANIRRAPTAAEIAAAAKNLALVGKIGSDFDAQQKIIEAENAKVAPQVPDAAAIVAAQAIQATIIGKVKVIFGLIDGDPKLSALLGQIPDRFGTSPASKGILQGQLADLRAVPGPGNTLADYIKYDSILLKVAKIASEKIVDDVTLNDRIQNILGTYQ